MNRKRYLYLNAETLATMGCKDGMCSFSKTGHLSSMNIHKQRYELHQHLISCVPCSVSSMQLLLYAQL